MNNTENQATRRFWSSIIARTEPHVDSASASQESAQTSESIPAKQLTADELKVLTLSSSAILGCTRLYFLAGLSRVKGNKLITRMVSNKWVTPHEFHPARRCGAVKVIEILEEGWNCLEPYGIEAPKKVLQGSWEHNLCGVTLRTIGKTQGYRVYFEVPQEAAQNRRVDVVWQSKDGSRWIWQCGISSPEREAKALVSLMPLIRDNKVALGIVCRDKAFLKKVTSHLKKEGVNRQKTDQITFKVVGDVLEEYFALTDKN